MFIPSATKAKLQRLGLLNQKFYRILLTHGRAEEFATLGLADAVTM